MLTRTRGAFQVMAYIAKTCWQCWNLILIINQIGLARNSWLLWLWSCLQWRRLLIVLLLLLLLGDGSASIINYYYYYYYPLYDIQARSHLCTVDANESADSELRFETWSQRSFCFLYNSGSISIPQPRHWKCKKLLSFIRIRILYTEINLIFAGLLAQLDHLLEP